MFPRTNDDDYKCRLYSGSESRLRLSDATRVPWEQVDMLFSSLSRVTEDWLVGSDRCWAASERTEPCKENNKYEIFICLI